MTATVVGFRWLDILEKEFDTAFVDLDSLIEPNDDLDEEEDAWVCDARKKMATLASCFAQLAHKSQTIFQLNAKLEAEMLNVRQNLAESEARNDVLKDENSDLIGQLHTLQIQVRKSSSSGTTEDMASIQTKIERDLKQRRDSCLSVEIPRKEMVLLRRENDNLRTQLMSLQGEVTGAQIASKYLDKELAGRIQQLQLIRNGKSGSHLEKVWKQLESEIQLHRYKTCVRACRKNLLSGQKNHGQQNGIPLPRPSSSDQNRVVTIKRKNNEDLGLSVTGGSEHNVPIIVSVVHSPSPASATNQLFVGDAILSVNGKSLRDLSHEQAVKVLAGQQGDVKLEVYYVLNEDEEDVSLTDESPSRFKIFDDDIRSVSSSIHSNQNGRLSRASIDSVRGSTENILSSSRLQTDFEDEAVEPSPNIEDKLPILNYIQGDQEVPDTAAIIHHYNNVAERLPDSIFDECSEVPFKHSAGVNLGEIPNNTLTRDGIVKNLADSQDETVGSTQNLLPEQISVHQTKWRSDSTCSRVTDENEETVLFNSNY